MGSTAIDDCNGIDCWITSCDVSFTPYLVRGICIHGDDCNKSQPGKLRSDPPTLDDLSVSSYCLINCITEPGCVIGDASIKDKADVPRVKNKSS